MKLLAYYFILTLLLSGCFSAKNSTSKKDTTNSDSTVRIANDSLEYEIIIIDNGFETYLNTLAKPKHFYSQNYYESKNKNYVTEWNLRASNPFKYNLSIYENRIEYDFFVNYGLDVNYKLYNYFKFVEYKYQEKF